MSKHFLSGQTYDAYTDTGPGSIVVDPLAEIHAVGPVTSALTLFAGPWTAKIDGTVDSEDAHAITILGGGKYRSNVTIGAAAEISAGGSISAGIAASYATNITNAGHVTGGFVGLNVYGNGSYAIKNLKTGVIEGDYSGVYASAAGMHTILNAGKIVADLGIAGGSGIEVVTNYGILEGGVSLGDNNDVFTNFKKVGHSIKHGAVTGTIDLAGGNDVFNGGSTREFVKDFEGKDLYKLGAGNDHFIGYLAGGDDRADRIDGGKGIDAYDASQAGVSGVIINLDSRTHFDTSYTRKIAANRADDVNNPATAADKILSIENAYGSAGNDSMFGTKGANELVGGDGNDHVFGLVGNDRLFGNNGLDALIGGAGTDELWGGADADLFVFQSLKDSGLTAATRDTIKDYEINVDQIDLDALNAKIGNEITGFLGVDVDFTGHKGDLRAVTEGANTIVELDVNGDKKADFSIQLDGQHALTIDDFFF
jgi:Ca2+-binding RTX toxin-like protein